MENADATLVILAKIAQLVLKNVLRTATTKEFAMMTENVFAIKTI